MRVMNRRLNLPNMQKVLMEFERQNERMEMTSDMMGDAIDDAMEVRCTQGWAQGKGNGLGGRPGMGGREMGGQEEGGRGRGATYPAAGCMHGAGALKRASPATAAASAVACTCGERVRSARARLCRQPWS
jgi:hypothetical protein